MLISILLITILPGILSMYCYLYQVLNYYSQSIHFDFDCCIFRERKREINIALCCFEIMQLFLRQHNYSSITGLGI